MDSESETLKCLVECSCTRQCDTSVVSVCADDTAREREAAAITERNARARRREARGFEYEFCVLNVRARDRGATASKFNTYLHQQQ